MHVPTITLDYVSQTIVNKKEFDKIECSNTDPDVSHDMYALVLRTSDSGSKQTCSEGCDCAIFRMIIYFILPLGALPNSA
jgi:hypothetical protein